MKMLKSDEGRKALEELYKINKLQELFPNNRIASVDDFLNKLNDQDVFEKLFK